jgi:hypothetical protein
MNKEARMLRTWRLRVPAAMLALALVGCGRTGPPIGSVSGKVTLNGKPVTNADICFASPEGYGASARLSANGEFRLGSQYGPGIPLGKYRVSIVPRRSETGPSPFAPTPSGPKASKTPGEVPAKYQNMETSGLTANVDGQQRVFTFDLH